VTNEEVFSPEMIEAAFGFGFLGSCSWLALRVPFLEDDGCGVQVGDTAGIYVVMTWFVTLFNDSALPMDHGW
jgi:hypothetical protein